ncbi:hypothetical protein ATANTOWER_026411, partial [Ataeniobius toweri]|nr:hypothetical protein [Ataeniobius toweri]
MLDLFQFDHQGVMLPTLWPPSLSAPSLPSMPHSQVKTPHTELFFPHAKTLRCEELASLINEETDVKGDSCAPLAPPAPSDVKKQSKRSCRGHGE